LVGAELAGNCRNRDQTRTCTASTDGDVSSDPAGQDVSHELDAVHGPRPDETGLPR
jgi:hypothetical protein